MYELKRAKSISEQLKLGNEILTINIDIEKFLSEFNAKKKEMEEAEKFVRSIENGSESIEKYEAAVLPFFCFVLGEENCEKIYNYFDGKIFEMSAQIAPFITQVLVPQINGVSKQLKTSAEQKYVKRSLWDVIRRK